MTDAQEITMVNAISNISSGTKQSSDKASAGKDAKFAELLSSLGSGSNQSDTDKLLENINLDLQSSSGAGNFLNMLMLMNSMNNQTSNGNSILSNLISNDSSTNINNLMDNIKLNGNISSIIEKLSDSIDNMGNFTPEQKHNIKSDLTKIMNILNNKKQADSKVMSNLAMLNFLSSAMQSYSNVFSQDISNGSNNDSGSTDGDMSNYMNQIVQLCINKISKPENSSNTDTTNSELKNLYNDLKSYFTISSADQPKDIAPKIQQSETADTVIVSQKQQTSSDDGTDDIKLKNVLDLLNRVQKENQINTTEENKLIKNIKLIKSLLNSNTSETQQSQAVNTEKADNLYDVLSSVLKGILAASQIEASSVKNSHVKYKPIEHPKAITENMPVVDNISSLNSHDDSGKKDNGFSNMNQNLKQSFSENEKELKILNNIKQSGENETNSDDSINDSKINQFMNMFNNLKNTDNVQGNDKVISQPVLNQKTFAQDFIKTVKYMENNNIKNLTVKIQPKDLGEIVIKLTTENGVMKANITASTKEGYNLLNTNLADMTNKLNNTDVKVEQLSLSMYDSNANDKGQSSHEENKKNYNKVKSVSNFFNDDDSDESTDYSSDDYNNLNILA